MDGGDPFLQVQSEVLSQLNSSRSLFQSYLRIRSSASSWSSPELTEARKELQNVLSELQNDVEDLVETVKMVERDPYKYGLEVEEVRRRRRLVDDVGKEIITMHEDLKSAQDSQIKSPSYLPDPSKFDENEDYTQEYEQQRQQEIMREQDQGLDDLTRTVRTLREQGGAMNLELEEQGQLLDEMDTVADRVGGKLQTGLRRIGEIVRQSEDKWSSCWIGLLITVLIILLILLLVL